MIENKFMRKEEEARHVVTSVKLMKTRTLNLIKRIKILCWLAYVMALLK